MRFIMMSLVALTLLTGCSTKEMKSTVHGWGDDISNAFKGSKDESGEK